MIVFLSAVILSAVIYGIVEAIKLRKDRKYWIGGHYYEHSDKEWLTARLTGDPERKEFKVIYNFEDGHYYDELDFGYIDHELYIKKEEDEEEE